MNHAGPRSRETRLLLISLGVVGGAQERGRGQKRVEEGDEADEREEGRGVEDDIVERGEE